MTYNVFGGTLSLTQSINHVAGRSQSVSSGRNHFMDMKGSDRITAFEAVEYGSYT